MEALDTTGEEHTNEVLIREFRKEIQKEILLSFINAHKLGHFRSRHGILNQMKFLLDENKKVEKND